MSTRSNPHDAIDSHRDGPPTFRPGSLTCVVDERRQAELQPGHEGLGWLAQRAIVPLGYLDDEPKSRCTFPEIAGVRCAIPGDRARLLANGDIGLIGRDSSVINSGGEKIFAEEVERASIATQPLRTSSSSAARRNVGARGGGARANRRGPTRDEPGGDRGRSSQSGSLQAPKVGDLRA